MAKIDFIEETVGHFISDNFLKVPTYQRSFAWEAPNVQELFEDIRNSFPEDYFIGAIVVTNKEDYLEIVDGQQRLATICLFFVAVRNLLKQNENDKWKYIDSNYLIKESLRDEDKKPRLLLNSTDNDFFITRILQNDTSITPSKASHKRILDAFQFIEKFVESEFKSKGLEGLFNLIEFINKQLRIVVVKVPDDVNAFTIFETLNDRGLALSQTDLIKNYLFNKAENRLGEAQDKWARITGAIESAASEEEILQYLRYYWSSQYGLTREKELFKAIKNKITNKNLALSFLSNLEKGTEIYLSLLNPHHPLWGDYPAECAKYISELNELGLIQPRPLLLALLEIFSDKNEVEKSLKLIVSWSVRNLITGTVGAGTLEKQFSFQAKLINEGEITNSKELKSFVSKYIPTDEQFSNAFKIATVSKSHIARYYLRKIEEAYRKNKELSPLENPERVNLEHILPENPDNLTSDWPEFDETKHKTYLKRIGNLTLISSKLNKDAANANFATKKNVYKNSEIEITKALAQYERWTPTEIEQRQEEFAKEAVKIWEI
jgi:uncharacterized protein with ParB-like and HNH nuclease domain